MADPQITLTPDQVAQLREITANGSANFAAGYQYINSIIQNHSIGDSSRPAVGWKANRRDSGYLRCDR
jgi:hypothetical protein